MRMAHITRFGNTYSDREWKEMQENFDREAEEARDYLDKRDAMLRHSARMLEDIGVDGNTFGIATRIAGYGLDGIQFSSQEKQEAVEKIADWIAKEDRELW